MFGALGSMFNAMQARNCAEQNARIKEEQERSERAYRAARAWAFNFPHGINRRLV